MKGFSWGEKLSAVKVFGGITLSLFLLVGFVGVVKKKKGAKELEATPALTSFSSDAIASDKDYVTESIPDYVMAPITYEIVEEKAPAIIPEVALEENLDIDRVERLFSKGKNKLPFVETVTYKSRVSWLQGRPAWIADYASYFGTSRHFIARSLNGKKDYYTQKVSSGDQFNVFQKNKDVRFYLVVDLSKLRMWFYAFDASSNYRYLLKTYKVGCGRVDKDSPSGCLTPLGAFNLSDKVAIYRPGVEGFFKEQKVEMIQVFGTRWMPYQGETDETAAMIKGFGMHGVPWFRHDVSGELIEDRETIGKHDSSGCIRLLQEDIEELFSIVITKPTTVEIVKEFAQAKLPGVEWIDHEEN